MSNVKRVAKNSTYIFLTSMFSKILTLVIIIMLARYLGVEDYGKFSFAFSFVGLFSIFGIFGIPTLMKRLVARNKKDVNKYFFNGFVLTSIMNVCTFGLIMLAAYLLRYDLSTMNTLILTGLFVVFQNIKVPFKSTYEAFERMHYVFWTRAGKIVLRLILVILFIYYQMGLLEILGIYVFCEAIMLFVDFWLYNKYIAKMSFAFKKDTWKYLLKKSVPFGVAGLFMTIYDKIDVTMLSKMVSNPDLVIGWYSSSYELMSAMSFIALSISGALAPIAYRSFVNNKKRLIKIYSGTFKIFLSLSIPISIGGVLLAEKIIFLIYGSEFSGAVISFQILIWAVIFNFMMFAFGLALDSMNLEKETMKATIISVIFNIVANIILIPILSYIGAAITTVASVLLYNTYCFVITQKRLVKLNVFKILLPILLSATIMGLFLYFTRDYLHVIVSVILGSLVYASALYLFKGVDKEYIQMLQKLIKDK